MAGVWARWLGRVSPRELAWQVPLAIGASAFILFMLLRSDGIGSVADILALVVGVGALGVAVFTRQSQVRHPPPAHDAVTAPDRLLTGLVSISLASVLALVVWFCHNRFADLPVRFGADQQVAEDSTVTVPATVDKTPWRGRLTVTPRLAPTSSLGNCVLPATLHVTAIVDGQPQPGQDSRHDGELSMAIPEGARDVQLRVELDVPGNQGCVVKVAFMDGTLRR